MSNVIQLLERLGQDASLQDASRADLFIQESDVVDSAKTALLDKSRFALANVLDAKSDIVCFVAPAEDDEEDTEEQDDEVTSVANL